MKKVFKIIGVLLILVLIALVTIPYFYKDEIEQFIKEDINKNLNAKFDYKDISLSLIKDFPNLNVTMNNITIDGIDAFENIRFAEIADLKLSLDAKKVFWEKNFEINKIDIDKLNLNIIVNKDGKANYDIVKEATKIDSTNTDNSFKLKLKDYSLSNSNIKYHDLGSGMLLDFKDINHKGNGEITDKSYELNTLTSVESASFKYDTEFLNQAKIILDSKILIEDDYMKYSFTNPQLKVNNLDITFEKSMVWLKDEDILLDFAFKTQNKLKQILSLVPKEYLESIKDVTANGNASFNGMVKGAYNNSNYPAYAFNLNVKKGSIKYPDLPETIQDIDVDAKVKFAGGKNLDNTTIDLSNLHLQIADNAVDGMLQIKNPMTDPQINTALKSDIDLSKLKNAIKIPGVKKLQGILDTDFKLKGKLSAIENKNFDQFEASGYINVSDLIYASDSISHTLNVKKAAIDVTPKALVMKDINANIGDNDFSINGKINNYIAYFLSKDEVLKADFTMHSKKLNLNDFMDDEETETDTESETGSIQIPKNIDVKFVADVDNLRYKDMDLKDVKGNLIVLDEKASLTAVFLKTLEGQMKFNGVYDTSEKTPKSSFDIKMEDLSITKSANTFTTFDSYAPVLKKISGKFFSNLKMDVDLDKNMNPIMETVNASGTFNTNSTNVKGIELLSKIGKLLKFDALNNPNIDKIKAQFSIADGVMKIKPFNFKLNGMQSSLLGSVNLNKQIHFVLDIDIPREKLGTDPNVLLEGLVGKLSDLGLDSQLGEIIKMKFSITGDYNNPKIKPMLAGYEGMTTEEIITEVIEDKVEEVIDEKVEEAREEAKKQAAIIMAAAQVQADALISKAQQAGEEVKKQAKKQGDKLVADASNPFTKLAAQTAAKELNKKADKTAIGIVQKAQTKADEIVATAQQKADKLLTTEMEFIK